MQLKTTEGQMVSIFTYYEAQQTRTTHRMTEHSVWRDGFCPSLFESFQSNLVRHLNFASIDQVDASQNSEGLSHQDMKQ